MSKKGFGRFALGAGIGAGLGMLFAPKSGTELRSDLKKKIDELIGDFAEEADDSGLLEMADEIMMGETGAGRSVLVRRMMEKGIEIITNAKVTKVDENIISYEKDGLEHHITNANTLIFANGYHVDPSIEEMLKDLNMTYYLIGDGHKVGNIKDAISEGYEITKDI